MIYDRLADIGDSLNIVNDKGFTPRLADHWTWSADSLSIAFHVNPKAKWHDGVPVRSNDVRFTIASTKDSTLGSSTAALLTNIDSVSTPDSATAVYWFHARAPQQFYDAVYLLPIMPEVCSSKTRISSPEQRPVMPSPWPAGWLLRTPVSS